MSPDLKTFIEKHMAESVPKATRVHNEDSELSKVDDLLILPQESAVIEEP